MEETATIRVKISPSTAEKLDQIERDNWNISGRGRTDTVTYLADFFLTHDSIERLVDKKLERIPDMIEKAFIGAMRKAVNNILSPESSGL